ncbi:ChaB1 [Parapoynx stagnalis nucleopolyhedrovirus]|uniref:ChaB1 n=1 Tax=Parapoynx stagnalis nucleopolyhedrovirus TaxID=2993413 RepID=A0A9E7YDQ1_9ABAC|nr:ChaB1 [Parapoynx stagnalis nucleopolyhedrovirus]
MKMYQIPEMLYNEKMPTRAKRLFTQTFSKYHKLNGGDEDIALHKARNALEEQYVKMDPSNSWIPKKAAYEIIKDNIDDHDDDDEEDDDDDKIQNNKKPSKILKQTDDSQSDYTSTDENDTKPQNNKKNRVKLTRRHNYFKQQHMPTNETSEDDDDEDDDYYNYKTNFYK